MRIRIRRCVCISRRRQKVELFSVSRMSRMRRDDDCSVSVTLKTLPILAERETSPHLHSLTFSPFPLFAASINRSDHVVIKSRSRTHIYLPTQEQGFMIQGQETSDRKPPVELFVPFVPPADFPVVLHRQSIAFHRTSRSLVAGKMRELSAACKKCTPFLSLTTWR